MDSTINLLSIQTPEHFRQGLEHRTHFDCGMFEVNIFETFQSSTRVRIAHDGLSISSMIRGSKTVHTNDGKTFRFLPGTSLILAEGETIYADFPEADPKNPVQCATILIPKETIANYLDFLEQNYPDENNSWLLNFSNVHLNNDSGIVRALNELLQIATQEESNFPLSDLLLKSLLVRMIHAGKEHIREQNALAMSSRLMLVKKFIKDNLDQIISIKTLMNIGNCSKSSLHRMFDAYCGKSPGEYILQERMISASNLLLNPDSTISDVAYQTGFSSVSYFVKQFKSFYSCTPGDFIRKFGKQ